MARGRSGGAATGRGVARVGGALRSLPRRGLGEDLSREVLRAARQRTLLAGLRDEPESRPLRRPARRSFRRLASRRTLAWLTVTAAIVAAVVLVGRESQPPGPGGQGGDQVAGAIRRNRSAAGATECR